MRKKLAKTAAILACLAVVLMYVPMTYAGPHLRFNFRQVQIDISEEIISAIFFFLPHARLIGLTDGKTEVLGTLDSLRTGGGNAKTTGTLDSLRTGGGNLP